MSQIEDLYNNYKQDIFSYLIWLTHNKSISEELMQETFVKAILSIHRFRGDSSVKTWLLSIARHLWLQNLRKSDQNIEYTNLLDAPIFDNAVEHIIDNELIKRVRELLSKKDDSIKNIMYLRFEGFSYAEISHKLAVSENTARVVFFRTINSLRLILKGEGFL